MLDPGFLEAHWFAYKRFDTDHDRDGIIPYADMFSKSASVILEKAEVDEAGSLSNRVHVMGEKSPTNLNVNNHWKELPGNEFLKEPRYVNLDYIHHFLPDVKIIILFRNPVERLYSDYNHVFGKEMPGHNVSAQEFHEMVVKGLKLCVW
jgi:N-acetylgalactosamine 4-sulfate 6-O-sulfotransferase